MNGENTEDKIRNVDIKGSIEVALIVDKMNQNRLRWLGNVESDTKLV